MDHEQQILAICDQWQNDLKDMAMEVTGRVRDAVNKKRDESTKTTEWYKFNIRIREINGGLQIQWVKSIWIKLPGAKSSKLVGEYVKPSVKHGYYSGSFRGASEEELTMILAAEEKLAKIRKRARVIGQIRSAIKLNYRSKEVEI